MLKCNDKKYSQGIQMDCMFDSHNLEIMDYLQGLQLICHFQIWNTKISQKQELPASGDTYVFLIVCECVIC